MAEEVKETCRPKFFIEPTKNTAKSEEEGRPIFETKKFVELKQFGDKSWSFVDEIDDNGKGKSGMDYAERFPKEYQAFKRGEERASVGTPLDEWAPLTRSRCAELKASNIFTVEEYAAIPDNILSKLGMGARAERAKAIAFLDSAKAGADTGKMAAQIAALQAMVEKLTGLPVPAAAEPQVGEIVFPRDKSLDECTDAELKDYIKRETGEGVRGQPSRETLLARAAEVASKAA